MKRIAVVDDTNEFLRFMEELLVEEGYEAVLWASGAGAHDMVLREKPALVVLDIRMEREDSGMLVLELLRLDVHTVTIPVIVCTADMTFIREQEARLQQLHCELQPKPFALDDLMEKVTRLIGPPER